MNYNDKINNVDMAAYLIALGYEMEQYIVTSYIDLNDRSRIRPKSGSWQFNDISTGFKKYGDCKEAIEKYKLPQKGSKIENLGELCKLFAHNYQVLKSVVNDNKELMQIRGDGYTVLKNENGSSIPISCSSLFPLDETQNIITVAIHTALGGRIEGYYFDENKILHVKLSNNPYSLKQIENVEL